LFRHLRIEQFELRLPLDGSPPIGYSGSAAGLHDHAIYGMLSGYDPEGETVSFSAVSAPTGATNFSLDSASGAFSLDPLPHFAGSLSFEFTLSAGGDTVGPYTETIDVQNNAPIVYDAGTAGLHDHTIYGMLGGYDPDGDQLNYTVASPPPGISNWNLDATTGNFSFDPPAHFAGLLTFQFHVDDGIDSVGPLTATIDVQNNAPIVYDAGTAGLHDHTIYGMLGGYDPDGDQLNYTVASPPPGISNWNLDATTGNFSFDPPAHFAGLLTFQFHVDDGIDSVGPLTATIDVKNNAPTGNDAEESIYEDGVLSFNILMAGGAYDPDGDNVTAILMAAPAHAASNGFTFNANGSVTYRPAAAWTGDDTFQYKFNDGIDTSPVYTATIHVNPLTLSLDITLDDEDFDIQPVSVDVTDDGVEGTFVEWQPVTIRVQVPENGNPTNYQLRIVTSGLSMAVGSNSQSQSPPGEFVYPVTGHDQSFNIRVAPSSPVPTGRIEAYLEDISDPFLQAPVVKEQATEDIEYEPLEAIIDGIPAIVRDEVLSKQQAVKQKVMDLAAQGARDYVTQWNALHPTDPPLNEGEFVSNISGEASGWLDQAIEKLNKTNRFTIGLSAPPKATTAREGISLLNSSWEGIDIKFTLGPGASVDALIIEEFKNAAEKLHDNGLGNVFKESVWNVMDKYSRLDLELTTDPAASGPVFVLKSYIQAQRRAGEFQFQTQPMAGVDALWRFGAQRKSFLGIQGTIPARDVTIPNPELPQIQLIIGRD
jgi:hypothetical protein